VTPDDRAHSDGRYGPVSARDGFAERQLIPAGTAGWGLECIGIALEVIPCAALALVDSYAKTPLDASGNMGYPLYLAI
jgi:hypothetical protein